MNKGRWNKYSSLKEWWQENPMHLLSVILNLLLSATIISFHIEALLLIVS